MGGESYMPGIRFFQQDMERYGLSGKIFTIHYTDDTPKYIDYRKRYQFNQKNINRTLVRRENYYILNVFNVLFTYVIISNIMYYNI